MHVHSFFISIAIAVALYVYDTWHYDNAKLFLIVREQLESLHDQAFGLFSKSAKNNKLKLRLNTNLATKYKQKGTLIRLDSDHNQF